MPTAVVQVTRGTTKAYVTDRKRKPGASPAVEGVPDPPTGTPSKRRKPSEPAASRARGVDLSRGSELTLKPSSDSRSNAEKPPIPALAQTKTVAGRALAASAAPPRAAAPPKAAAAKAQSSKQLTKAKSVPSVGGATGEVANLKADLESSMEDNAELTKTVESLQAERNELRAANSELEAKHAGATDEVAAMKRSLKTEQAETARLKAEQKKQKAELQAATSELEAGRQKAEQEASELKAALAAAKEEARAREATLDELTERSRAQEELRRKMHETIQDLKGNIRVFCRVRGGAATKAGVAVRCPPTEDSSVVELLPPAALGKQPREGGMVRFQFDRVFDETTSQQDVFTEVSQLTQSALDGFKVCIFAYGQTGSGKTFTMDGPRNQGDEARGVVPRAAEQAFARAEELKSLGWEYSFELSCLEIYNEELRDMLNKGNDKLKVVDSGDKVAVPGLSQMSVANPQELHKLLDAAARVRSTASTKCNDVSSRSHFLFRLKITGVNEGSNLRTEGELNLVDLAGSERVKESQVSGKALEEAKFINKSLTSLGDVISAMVTKAKHVPYRNSRLTHLLSNALRGKSKTLMFVNVSPAAEHHQETKSSLQFAQKVNGCDVGPAVRAVPKTPPHR